ncbi:MAG: helix-turn-helix transcriptional regulator [Bilophila wadsworthia]|uniref:helix-turn-helix transcriptional regulator n=1 Tax=Bilophila wadsworthia TaxID=35833 RepID=UPI00300F33FF
MMYLNEMTVTEAIRTAKEVSGKTEKEIANSLGISRGVITRYLRENDDYSPRMGIIPNLCHALENDILLQWLEVRIRKDRERQKEKMLLHVEKMEKALMGVKALLASKEEISPEDEEELHDLLDKMERECQRLNLLCPVPGIMMSPGRKAGAGQKGQGSKPAINEKDNL